MELDTIITGDSAVVLQGFEPDCIDLTVTSPPYDNLRSYHGFVFDFETIAKQLFRVTKAGGVVVWVVGDATVKGSETGTSFRQALYFMQCGFNLHDTMIYKKINPPPLESTRYQPAFEYMFVFSKGKPKSFNPLMVNCKYIGHKRNRATDKKPLSDNKMSQPRNEVTVTRDKKYAHNVWEYIVGKDGNNGSHTAVFPEALANDHIISWSNEGDTVLDCFCGSGTTPKMAKLLNRHYIGIDTSAEYVALANERLAQLERGLTQRVPDLWDSAPSQALSTLKANPLAEHLSTPPTSG